MNKHLMEIITALNLHWGSGNWENFEYIQPYTTEIGAATLHPETVFRCFDSKRECFCYVQPCIRPGDGSYSKDPVRLYKHHQYQVILKGVDCYDFFLTSLVKSLGMSREDIEYIKDDWENVSIGAYGTGWEIRYKGTEIAQLTRFRKMGNIDCSDNNIVEITYGLDRIAEIINPTTIENYYNRYESEFSNFSRCLEPSEYKTTIDLFKMYLVAAKNNMIRPLVAYDFLLKAIHNLNLADSNKLIHPKEKMKYMTNTSLIAQQCCESYIKSDLTKDNHNPNLCYLNMIPARSSPFYITFDLNGEDVRLIGVFNYLDIFTKSENELSDIINTSIYNYINKKYGNKDLKSSVFINKLTDKQRSDIQARLIIADNLITLIKLFNLGVKSSSRGDQYGLKKLADEVIFYAKDFSQYDTLEKWLSNVAKLYPSIFESLVEYLSHRFCLMLHREDYIEKNMIESFEKNMLKAKSLNFSRYIELTYRYNEVKNA